MAFDKETPNTPLVQPQKKTTQVNIGIAVAVAVFFVIVGVVLWTIVRNPAETQNDVNQSVQPSK